MNPFNIQRAFQVMQDRGWEKIYWLIDVHDVILEPDYEQDSIGGKFYPNAIKVLRMLTERKDICTILWTCSHKHIVDQIVEKLKQEDVLFDFANENPEVEGELGDYSVKLYANVILDDKAGFEGETDWFLVEQELIKATEKQNKVKG